VVLDATVSENGLLENVKLVSGHALLAQAAIDAVRQWRYRPYLLNGKPVRMQTKITVNFKMPEGRAKPVVSSQLSVLGCLSLTTGHCF